MTPRRIHNHPCRNLNFLFCNPQTNATRVALVIKKHFTHLNALVDTGAETLRMLQQEKIELLTIDMVSVLLCDSLLREFVEGDICFALCHRRMPGSAIFSWKSFPLHDGQEPDFIKHADRRHDHRFAHVRPRMSGGLEDSVLNARFRQVTPYGRTGRATANDYDVR